MSRSELLVSCSLFLFLLWWTLCCCHPTAGKVWDCNRPWPSLSLFLPFQAFDNNRHPRYWEVEAIFLRTYSLFWPLKLSKTSLLLAYDDEKRDFPSVRELNGTVNQLKQEGMKIDMIGIPEFPYYRSGYDRQQYVMFWADNFTDTDFIGYVDSDAAFITYVDREDLFEDGKPVVNARSGYHPNGDGVNGWSYGTYKTLGVLEPFKCMSYFPVIVKRRHLQGLRDHIARLHNRSFDEAFHDVINNPGHSYSQFAIMCTYLFYHHREEYAWFVHTETPNWDGITPPPAPGQDSNLSLFTPEMYRPKPRVVTHVRHRGCRQCSPEMFNFDAGKKVNRFYYFLKMGLCYSPPFPRTEKHCEAVKPDQYYVEMHNFDYVDYTAVNTVESLNKEAAARFDRIKNCTFHYESSFVQTIIHHGNLRR